MLLLGQRALNMEPLTDRNQLLNHRVTRLVALERLVNYFRSLQQAGEQLTEGPLLVEALLEKSSWEGSWEEAERRMHKVIFVRVALY